MNKQKTLDIIARKQREILELTERLHNAGYEATLTQIGVGSAVMVLVGQQLDPLQIELRSLYRAIRRVDVEILQAMVASGRSPLAWTMMQDDGIRDRERLILPWVHGTDQRTDCRSDGLQN